MSKKNRKKNDSLKDLLFFYVSLCVLSSLGALLSVWIMGDDIKVYGLAFICGVICLISVVFLVVIIGEDDDANCEMTAKENKFFCLVLSLFTLVSFWGVFEQVGVISNINTANEIEIEESAYKKAINEREQCLELEKPKRISDAGKKKALASEVLVAKKKLEATTDYSRKLSIALYIDKLEGKIEAINSEFSKCKSKEHLDLQLNKIRFLKSELEK